jgi:hypothetical protein
MSRQRPAEAPVIPAQHTRAAAPRWLILVHQLPPHPSNLRVRTWRRLQQLGAHAVKQAVYLLPDSPAAREDFEWLKTEIEGSGGEAAVFAASSIDAWSDDALVEEFRRARQGDYVALAEELERLLQKLESPRKRRGRAPSVGRSLEGFRQRLADLERVDFFGSAGRDRVAGLVARLGERARRGARSEPASVSAGGFETSSYRGRLWVTRPRPGVDRMGSAWLIRRFIDPDARFGFVADREAAPAGAVPFDMFGVDFTHQADRCTFETLCAAFALTDPALPRLAAIVHDLDLKDARFGAAEAASVGMVIDGLQLAHSDDAALLDHGITLFEALYRAAKQAARAAGPRAVARKATPRRASRPSSRGR